MISHGLNERSSWITHGLNERMLFVLSDIKLISAKMGGPSARAVSVKQRAPKIVTIRVKKNDS
jgi:hypothetical protein